MFTVSLERAWRAAKRRRYRLVAAWLLAQACVVGRASAGEKEHCVEDHAAAQELRRGGRLIASREHLARCARNACPEIVRSDCVPWLDEIEAAIPSVAITARTKEGLETAAVRVWIDRVLVDERLDGHAISLDPGEHAFVFAQANGAVEEKRITLREGEKMRAMTVTFAVPTPSVDSASATPRRSVALPAVLAGTGAVAIAASAYLGLSALHDRNALECQPYCNESEVAPIRTELRAGTVSLGIGVALGVIASVLFLTNSPHDNAGARTMRSPRDNRWDLRASSTTRLRCQQPQTVCSDDQSCSVVE